MRDFSAAATMHHVASYLLAVLLAIPLLPLRKDIKKILDSMGTDGSTRSSVS